MQGHLATICALLVLVAPRAHAGSLHILPEYSNGARLIPSGLMPDGNSLMGVDGSEVYRWTKEEGRVVLGRLGPRTLATAISGDGSTVVGQQVDHYSQHAFRWTAEEGMTLLPAPPGLPHNPSPRHVSYDGSVIYGTSASKFTRPTWDLHALGLVDDPFDFDDFPPYADTGVFRWDADNGAEILPQWTNPAFNPMVFHIDVSANGQVHAGSKDGFPAFWTSEHGFVQPTEIPTNVQFARTSLISADGTTIAGDYYPYFTGPGPYAPKAQRWKLGGPLEPLTDGTEYSSDVLDISSDGNTILGRMESVYSAGSSTFIWRESTGIQTLEEYCAEQGVALPPGRHSSFQMSDDGKVLLGSTTTKLVADDGSITFHDQYWLADLRGATVPEPGACVMLATALVFTVTTQRIRPD